MNFNINQENYTPDYELANGRTDGVALIIMFNIIWMLLFKLIRCCSLLLSLAALEFQHILKSKFPRSKIIYLFNKLCVFYSLKAIDKR